MFRMKLATALDDVHSTIEDETWGGMVKQQAVGVPSFWLGMFDKPRSVEADEDEGLTGLLPVSEASPGRQDTLRLVDNAQHRPGLGTGVR